MHGGLLRPGSIIKDGPRLSKGKKRRGPDRRKPGNGSLYSTVEDLSRWDCYLYTEKVLKRNSLEKMFRPIIAFSRDKGGKIIGFCREDPGVFRAEKPDR